MAWHSSQSGKRRGKYGILARGILLFMDKGSCKKCCTEKAQLQQETSYANATHADRQVKNDISILETLFE
jgi:hypothetical protein